MSNSTPASMNKEAKDYLASYDGPTTKLLKVFGSPVMKQLHKRDSPLFARNALYITYFARIQFDSSIVDPLEAALINKISGLNKKFGDKIEQAKILMTQNDIFEADMCVNNLPVEFEIVITSPLFRQYINLLLKADQLINHYDTLWMNGVVASSIFNDMRHEVKKELRGVVAFVRNTWIQLQKRLQHDKAVKIGEMTGEDMVAAVEKSVKAEKLPKPPKAPTESIATAPIQESLLSHEALAISAAE